MIVHVRFTALSVSAYRIAFELQPRSRLRRGRSSF
jgi:hypothetical protein